MAEYSTTDIIDYAMTGNTTELEKAVDDLMKERIAELLAVKKIEVAKNIFNPEE